MILKWGLLRGAAKDEDCEAAQNAWKKLQKKERSADDDVELSNVYGDTEATADGGPRGNTFMSSNPMHSTSPGATAMEGEEREGLLALFVTREEQHRDREEHRRDREEHRRDREEHRRDREEQYRDREEFRQMMQSLERRQDSLERETQGTNV
jgi:hypothetical protein